MPRVRVRRIFFTALFFIPTFTVWGHDPIFSIGPHVIFKDGFELALQAHSAERDIEKESEISLEVVYGITANWATGFEIPYISKDDGANKNSGVGDASVFTKYRFWRKDSFGEQSSASILFGLRFDNGEVNNGGTDTSPSLGNDVIDTLLGTAYGYEGSTWYHWISLRSLHHEENEAKFRQGTAWNFDLVLGFRGTPSKYLQADTVWMIELNSEILRKNELASTQLNDTGGNEAFLSPGIFWTYRNFAIKAGIQLPVFSDLNGSQEESDNRYKLVAEWHI
jgi:hypothetical protein